MFSLINNFFNSHKNLKNISSEFDKLKRNTNVEKIFKSIESHSPEAEIRYVGGCVRKILNQEPTDDIDLATNLNPTQVKKALEDNQINFYETGVEHGTITAIIENETYEITSLRSDISTDGRHAKVEFTKDWLTDAERRDFTINSIYSDLNGNLFDPFDGSKDLENGKIVFVGDPEKRIKEDYLRILRYIRFFSKYSKISHNQNIIKLINKNIAGISKISSDRLLDEFKKIFKNHNLDKICNDGFSYETLKLIFPQFKKIDYLKNLNNISRNKLHEIDFIFLISLMIIDETDNAEYFFYKFNLSKKAQKRILNIKEFYFNRKVKSKINLKDLWKLFYREGKDTLNDILNYKIFTSKKSEKKIIELLEFFKDKDIPVFPIKGEEIMKKFDFSEGKELGEKLRRIENHWIENDFKITEDEIEKIVKN